MKFIQYVDPANGGFHYCESSTNDILCHANACLSFAQGALANGDLKLASEWTKVADSLQSRLAIVN